ncbi:MAG: hypothetical protein AABY83_03285 [Pseudomonadota bacterium]
MKIGKLIPWAFATLLFTACGGGNSPAGGGPGDTGGGSAPGPSAIDAGTVGGIVTDAQTGARLAGVSVSGGGQNTTTNDRGEYTLSGLAKGTTVPISFAFDKYAPGFGNAQVRDVGEPLLVPLKKMGTAQNYNPTTKQTIYQKTESGPYAVIFEPGALNTTDTKLKVSITPLDPTLESSTLPGELTTPDTMLVPLTFAEFNIIDSSGNKVNTNANLAAGKEPIVELPIPVTLRKLAAYKIDTTNPIKIHCYSYDSVKGQWVDFVDGEIVLSSVDGVTPVVRAAIKHFSWYGAAPKTDDCVKLYGRVVSAVDGKPMADARVEAFPGGVTHSDARGDFEVVTSTKNTEPDIVATRTYTDVDGSVSGMKGAKVIDFGKVKGDLLTGLVRVNCKTGVAVSPMARGIAVRAVGTASDPLMVPIGRLNDFSYKVIASLMAGIVFANIEVALPAGIDGGAVTGAHVTLVGPTGNVVKVTEVGDGFYSAAATVVPGARYTLNIDADGNGSIDGTGSVYAVGDVAWTYPINNAVLSSSADLVFSWSDTGYQNSGYSPVYFASVIKTATSSTNLLDLAAYFGTATQFKIGDVHNNMPLSPGTYTTTLMAMSGPSSSGPTDLAWVNNITGANVGGMFSSQSIASPALTFTVQ